MPHTLGTVLDSGAQVNILSSCDLAPVYNRVTVITGAGTEAETADAIFPVIATDRARHAIQFRGKNIVATRATNSILFIAVLAATGRVQSPISGRFSA